MADQLTPITIKGPGFRGLNIQDSEINEKIGWSLVSDNCVFDDNNRLASRKGYTVMNTGDSIAQDIQKVFVHKEDASTSYVLSTTAAKIYQGIGTTLTDITGTAAPTDGTWKFVTYQDWTDGTVCIGVQDGHTPIIWNGTGSFAKVSYAASAPNEHVTVTGFPINGNEILSAFGRLWVVSQDKSTVYWNKLGTSNAAAINWGSQGGELDLRSVWPDGIDQITALAAYESDLVIFGRKNILIYQNPSTPDDPDTPIQLKTVIAGIGCVARDSVRYIGDDMFFLSHTGIRSLKRSMITQNLPSSEVTKNIRDYFASYIDGIEPDFDRISSVYHQLDGFYLIMFPYSTGSSTDTVAFYVDTKLELEDGTRRICRWPGLVHRGCDYDETSDTLYFGTGATIGANSYAHIARYTGYTDNGSSYKMEWISTWKDFESPSLKFPKKMAMIIAGGSNYNVNFKWGFDFDDELFSTTSTVAGNNQDPNEYNVATSEWGGQAVANFDTWTASTSYYPWDIVIPTTPGNYIYALDVERWTAGTSYAPHSLVAPQSAFVAVDSDDDGVTDYYKLEHYDYVFKMDATGGTSGGSEPTWVEIIDDITPDNGMQWTCKAFDGVIGISDNAEPGAWDTSSPNGETADNTLLWKTRDIAAAPVTEWSGTDNLSSYIYSHLKSNGQHLRYGIAVDVDGFKISIQRLDFFVKIGRLNRSAR